MNVVRDKPIRLGADPCPSWEAVGEQADTLDNLIGAMKLPLPAHIHLEALRGALPNVRDALRKAVADCRQSPRWKGGP